MKLYEGGWRSWILEWKMTAASFYIEDGHRASVPSHSDLEQCLCHWGGMFMTSSHYSWQQQWESTLSGSLRLCCTFREITSCLGCLSILFGFFSAWFWPLETEVNPSWEGFVYNADTLRAEWWKGGGWFVETQKDGLESCYLHLSVYINSCVLNGTRVQTGGFWELMWVKGVEEARASR